MSKELEIGLTLLNEESTKLIVELIKKGWHFYLSWDDMELGKGDMCWEAEFTKRLPNTKENVEKYDAYNIWDNHKPGISKTSPDDAVRQSYDNVKKGVKPK